MTDLQAYLSYKLFFLYHSKGKEFSIPPTINKKMLVLAGNEILDQQTKELYPNVAEEDIPIIQEIERSKFLKDADEFIIIEIRKLCQGYLKKYKTYEEAESVILQRTKNKLYVGGELQEYSYPAELLSYVRKAFDYYKNEEE